MKLMPSVTGWGLAGKGVLAVPLLAVALGALLVVFGWWERQRTISELDRLFDEHVQSIASQIDESTRQATAATALFNDLVRERLASDAAALLQADCDVPSVLPGTGFARPPVAVNISAEGGMTGDWGPVGEAERPGFLEAVDSETGDIADYLTESGVRLHCLAAHRSGSGAFVCADASRIDEIQKRTGLPALLRGVIRHDVVYVGIQDATGILAAAPSADMLSSWDSDGTLAEALDGRCGPRMTRTRVLDGQTVYEGLSPFRLADRTTALLRIGVDGSVLARIRDASARRFAMLVAVTTSVVVLAFVLAVVVGVSRRRQRAAAELLAAREADRKHWEMMGQMASTVAHEVRNPLNTLGIVAQRMGSEFEVPAGQRQEFDTMLEVIKGESARVNRVVTDFLELGRPIVLDPVEVNAGQMIQTLAAPSEIRAGVENKNFVLDNRCSGSIRLDRARFGQVWANLVGNALDAVGDRGTVEVVAACDSTGLRLTVRDDGPGIEPERLSEVMKPFVSMKSTGTGLGLPVVVRLCEAMGGTFSLDSTPGAGTVAEVFIPPAGGVFS